MAVQFVIPGPLRELARNQDRVKLKGSPQSVNDALAMLWAEYPALRDRVITELGEVRPHVNIFVIGEFIRDLGGLGAAVGDGAEVVILPAVSRVSAHCATPRAARMMVNRRGDAAGPTRELVPRSLTSCRLSIG